MSNRRKLFAGIAGLLAIVVGGYFVRPQKARRAAQAPPEKAITVNDSRAAANPQQQATFLIGDGDRMMEDGDYVNARSFYEAALKLEPSNPAARAGIKSAEDAMNGKH